MATQQVPPSQETIANDGSIIPSSTSTSEVKVDSTPSKEEVKIEESPKPLAIEKEGTKIEEVKEDATTMDDFNAVLDKPFTLDTASKKKEEKKVETSSTPTTEKKEEVKIEVTPKVDNKPAARDYTGVPPEVKPLLERMSNEAFAHFKPIALELPQLQQKLKDSEIRITELSKGRPPENYQEHPNAYILSAEFESAAKDVQAANIVYQHWKQQYDAVESGALKYRLITKDAQGNLVLGDEREAGPTAKSDLMGLVNWSQNQAEQKKSAIIGIQQSHGAKYKEATTWLDNAEKEWFTVVNDDKHPFQPLIKSTLEAFPPALRANPLARPLAKSLVLNLKISELVQQLKKGGGKIPTADEVKEQERQEKLKEQVKEAGPNGSVTSAATGSGKKEDDITFEDFQKVIEGD